MTSLSSPTVRPSGGGSNGGAIAAGVIVTLLLVAALIAGGVFWYRRRSHAGRGYRPTGKSGIYLDTVSTNI